MLEARAYEQRRGRVPYRNGFRETATRFLRMVGKGGYISCLHANVRKIIGKMYEPRDHKVFQPTLSLPYVQLFLRAMVGKN